MLRLDNGYGATTVCGKDIIAIVAGGVVPATCGNEGGAFICDGSNEGARYFVFSCRFDRFLLRFGVCVRYSIRGTKAYAANTVFFYNDCQNVGSALIVYRSRVYVETRRRGLFAVRRCLYVLVTIGYTRVEVCTFYRGLLQRIMFHGFIL